MTLKEIMGQLTEAAIGMRILYVEDEPSIREHTRWLLSTIFSEIEVASDGLDGLNKYQMNKFDIVITDILMPEMNGIEMIKKIKEINFKQQIIVTSACEESNYLLELINLGIAQFLLKPIQTNHIIQNLYEVVTNIYNQRKVDELNSNIKQELIHQTILLEQYKEVVDVSSIVTKTDLQGNIIYVNDLFSQKSGFDFDEIKFSGHNILRHSEMSSEFYEHLWKKILNKETWSGTIKNMKKDGGYYIADTTIKPILDEFGDTIDYISISHDVTEMYDLNEEIWQTQHEMLSLLGEVGETRSQETGNHVRRVAKYAKLLGELHGLDEEDVRLLYSAAPMHDIGKIGIPDAILLKPGRLEDHEFEIMKKHSDIGHNILKNSKRPLLQAAAIIAREHHEKWDGTGYPHAIKGDEIHIYGRITALADVFDALSCERIYKRSWPMDEIIDYIKSQREKQFDPKLVDLFVENVDDFIEIAIHLKD
ncbi:MAG: response regulator [Sulfuricurvum sp.]|nr:response regulator [Sulfuricurvum sp.]